MMDMVVIRKTNTRVALVIVTVMMPLHRPRRLVVVGVLEEEEPGQATAVAVPVVEEAEVRNEINKWQPQQPPTVVKQVKDALA